MADLGFDGDFGSLIFDVRGQKVMLDKDLAKIYMVEVRAINQAVNRRKRRFPERFVFQLTCIEAENLVSQGVIPSKSYFGGHLPYVFTEQGALTLSGVLKSEIADIVCIKVADAFVSMRDRIREIEQQILNEKNREIENERVKFGLLLTENKSKEKEIEKLKPAADIYNLYIADNKGRITINQVSNILQLGKDYGVKWIYRLLVNRNMITENYNVKSGYESLFYAKSSKNRKCQLLIYPKGLEVIRRLAEIDLNFLPNIV